MFKSSRDKRGGREEEHYSSRGRSNRRDDFCKEREWFLLHHGGSVAFPLSPHRVILIGNQQCDINIQSRSVDKRHAVLCFDPSSQSFSVKDLNSNNGTFLNNRRISADRPEKLENMDLLRFGYDPNLYEIRVGTSKTVDNNEEMNVGNVILDPNPSNHHHPMQGGQQQGSRVVYGNRVSSPSLTLDSGRGSSSAPSSPAKEMSPIPGPISSQQQQQQQYGSSIGMGHKFTHHGNRDTELPSHPHGGGMITKTQETRLMRFPSSEETIVRKDSLEDGMDKIMYPSSAVGMDFDLDVPNEVFDHQLEAKEEIVLTPPASTVGSLPRKAARSRSRSISGGDNGNSDMIPLATPLYGTPHWWPHQDPEPDENLSHHAHSTRAVLESRVGDMTSGGGAEPLSLNSEISIESSLSESASAASGKKISPMAFTVDFDDDGASKRFGISDSISKFVPSRHRRNLSITNKPSPSSTDTDSTNKVSKSKNAKSSTSKPTDNKKSSNSNSTDLPATSSNSTSSFSAKGSKLPKIPLSLFSRGRLGKSASVEETTTTMINTNTIVKTKAKVIEVPLKNKNEPIDREDASSETGTYTVDKDNPEPAVDKARKDVENLMHKDNEDLVASTAPEWVREWAEQAAIQHIKNKDVTNPLTETQLFLQETENVMCAMQERVTRNLSTNNLSSHNSDSDDEATLSHNTTPPKASKNRFKFNDNPRTSSSSSKIRRESPLLLPVRREASVLSDSGYQIGYQSDSSNEGGLQYKNNIGAVKMNKAFNIRRGRVVGYDSDTAALNRHSFTATSTTAPAPLPLLRGISPRPSTANTNTSSPFGRNDGGRFSLRMSKSQKEKVLPNQMMMPPPTQPPRSTPVKSVTNNPSSRPPVQQMSSRKPPTGSTPGNGRSNSTLTAKEVELANWKRRKSYDPMRAAAQGRRKRDTNSATETNIDDLTPTSMSSHSAVLMSKSMSFHMESGLKSPHHSTTTEEEDMIYVVDERDSCHSNSPIHLPMNPRSSHHHDNYHGSSNNSSCSIRPKNKLEALDNLVIATIHSLSNKVRTSSRQLLERMQLQHTDNENGALLEEMVSQLKELEISSSNSSPNKSPSRELSGTLKNLKKLEQVILVLDRVLCDDSGSDANN